VSKHGFSRSARVTTGYTDKMAEYLATVTPDALPAAVVECAKAHILDTLGCAIVGRSLPMAATVSNYVHRCGGTPEASVVGAPQRAPLESAVLANAMMAAATGISDTHLGASCHAGSGVLFCTLAAAENVKASGREVILAVVLGYEVAARLAMALGPAELYRRGFHPSMFGLPFGCAVATAKVLGSDKARMAQTLSLVDLWDPRKRVRLLKASPYYFFKYAGSAVNGLRAGAFAQNGVEGVPDALDDEEGLFRPFSTCYDQALLTRGLGASYEIVNVVCKKYACCHNLEPAIDAVLELVSGGPLGAIDGICVKVPTAAYATVRPVAEMPKNEAAAMFHGGYLMAVAALMGTSLKHYRLREYLETLRKDDRIADLARRVHIAPDSALDEIYPEVWSADVEVHARGEVYKKRVDMHPRKSALDYDGIRDKFARMCAGQAPQRVVDRLAEVAGRLECLPSVHELTALLREARVT